MVSMTDPEARLKALWTLDEPPARDPAFEGFVAARIERRRWRQTVVEFCAVAFALLVAGWAAWPFIATGVVVAAPWLAAALAIGLAVWSIDLTFDGLLFGGYEDFTRDFASE
jgi:putative Mn2+ efflux pump MntP